jgi:nucleotide-binding universal stress UspA family protein
VRYLVAYSADSGGRGALAVGRLFALSDGVPLTVCTITPTTWGYPSLARVDLEYARFLDSHASDALAEARKTLGEDIEADFVTRSARSTREGILELADEIDAGLIILGSARGGALGRFAVGSVTDHLLHGAPVPVVLAPRGYRPARRTRLQRVTCGFVGGEYSAAAVSTACDLARRHHIPVRLLTGVVRDRQMYPSLVGLRSEREVEQQWRDEVAKAHAQALADLPGDVTGTAEIVEGPNWEEALDAAHWEDGEILVIGSGRMGVGRIFLGSNASKIVRSAPVPTVVAPGSGP